MPARKNLNIEFDIRNLVRPILCSPEVFHHLLRLYHILKHCFDLVDGIVAALDLQFVNHEFLSLVRNTGSVQQSLGEHIGVGANKDISTVKTAKESDNSIEFLVDLIFAHLFKSLFELVVTVDCNVMGGLIAFVHEVLE